MILDGSVLLDEELHKGWRQTVGTVWFQEGGTSFLTSVEDVACLTMTQ